MADSRQYMKRALELARLARGKTAPNPAVGCVIVKDGVIAGEGFHEAAGRPHAEINALAQAGERAGGSDVFVTLEPCNHHGATPPCVDALIAADVKTVTYAMDDPNPAATGGAGRLRAAGIAVNSGLCGDEAIFLNRAWLHRIENGRPYFIAKFAASLDGKIATRTGESQWITNAASRARAHELRREADAIIAGANTVIADDPALTARIENEDVHYPLRIVLDSMARTPPGAKVFDRAGKGALLVTTDRAPQAARQRFREHGVDVLPLRAGQNGRPDVDDLSRELFSRGLNTVMLEGGGEIIGAFFDAGLVDEVWAFLAPVFIGGPAKGPIGGGGIGALSDAFRLSGSTIEHLDGDILLRGKIHREETA